MKTGRAPRLFAFKVRLWRLVAMLKHGRRWREHGRDCGCVAYDALKRAAIVGAYRVSIAAIVAGALWARV